MGKGKHVTVTGPKGTLDKKFSSVNLDMTHITTGLEEGIGGRIWIDLWFGNKKQNACIRTISSAIDNMVTGVQKGFLYKMKFVYSHFPINVTINGDVVEIRNFMGEKRVRKVKLMDGVTGVRSADVKDELQLSGIDLSKVSICAAQVQQMTNIRKK